MTIGLRKVKLPEWTDLPNLHILAGVEQVAKRENGVWYVKDKRCNLCGWCCKDVPEDWDHGYNSLTGNCKHLKHSAIVQVKGKRFDEYLCDLGDKRPYCCCVSGGELEHCSIIWREDQ